MQCWGDSHRTAALALFTTVFFWNSYKDLLIFEIKARNRTRVLPLGIKTLPNSSSCDYSHLPIAAGVHAVCCYRWIILTVQSSLFVRNLLSCASWANAVYWCTECHSMSWWLMTASGRNRRVLVWWYVLELVQHHGISTWTTSAFKQCRKSCKLVRVTVAVAVSLPACLSAG